MTYFTDSVYERMMMEKPRCRREKKNKEIKNKDGNQDDKSKHYRELIIIPKEKKKIRLLLSSISSVINLSG